MKNPKSDVSVLIATFLLTVIFDLTIAIEIGLLISHVPLHETCRRDDAGLRNAR